MSSLGALCSHLKNDSGVSGELSADTDVYIDVADPGHGGKYIVVQRIPGTDHHHHQGGATGLVFERFQISCWAGDPLDAETIGDKVRLALDGKITGGTLGTTPNDIAVIETRVDDESADYVAPEGGRESGTYGWRVVLSLWRTEVSP